MNKIIFPQQPGVQEPTVADLQEALQLCLEQGIILFNNEIGFKLRILDLGKYSAVIEELNSIADSDEEILDKILDYCRIHIDNPDFLHWNEAGISIVRDWQQRLRDAEGNASVATAEAIAPTVISLRCMPSFQFSYLSGQERSPNLILLSEDDGGLYGLL